MNQSCLTFIDRLLHSPASDPEMAEHVAHCPDCAAAQKAAQAVRLEKTLLPPASSAMLQKIMNALPPEGAVSDTGGGQQAAGSVFGKALIGGAAVLLIAVGVALIAPSASRPTVPATTAQWSDLPAPVDGKTIVQKVPLESISTRGVTVRFVSPSTISEQSEGMTFIAGKASFTVPAASAAFLVQTPQQRILCRGGRFTVEIRGSETFLTVDVGEVETISTDGVRKVLSASSGKPTAIPVVPPRVGTSATTIPGTDSPPE